MKKLIKIGVMIIFIMASFVFNGQELTMEGYNQLTKDGDTISQHTQYHTAIQSALEQGPGTYYVNPAPIRVTITKDSIWEIPRDTIYIEKEVIVRDTVETFIGDDWSGLTNMKVVDTVTDVYWNYGNVRHESYGVLSSAHDNYPIQINNGITVPYYAFTARLKRIKHWPEAKTTYELVDVPFHFYKSDSVYGAQGDTLIRIRAFGSKRWAVNHIVDGIKREGDNLWGTLSIDPGQSTYGGGSFRHSNTVILPNRSEDHEVILEAIDVETGKVLGQQTYLISKL